MIKVNNLASFVVDGLHSNDIFDLNSSGNRDGCFEPYLLLKQMYLSLGIELNTSDVNNKNKVLFELHMDVQKKISNTTPCYLMLYEAPQMKPSNQDQELLDKYRLIFTWCDDLVDGDRYIKFNLPNNIIVNDSRGWLGREGLCCLIAGNKALRQKSQIDLYVERVKTIRWFEKNAPWDFDLYGQGWDRPAARNGLISKVLSKLQQYNPIPRDKVYFPSYRGRVVSKLETLKKYRFSICYENVRNIPGYITEKIFDSFFAGCVPVYWGASNIAQYIPEDCFIDRRKFNSHDDLYYFMLSMKESDFIDYQDRIAAFLISDSAKEFSSKAFAQTIVNATTRNLDLAS